MVYLKLFLTAAIWGGTFVAGRIVAGEAGPFSAAFYRFLIASICLLVMTRRVEGPLPRLNKGQFLKILFMGLTGIMLYNVFFFQGLKTIPASRASVIIAANPILIFLGAVVFFRERLTGPRLAAIVLSFSGAWWVISRGHPFQVLQGEAGWGEIFILGCVASWVAYSLIGKVTLTSLRPFAATTFACLIGTAGLLPMAVVESLYRGVHVYSAKVWIGLAYLGLCGSAIGFSWYYQGIKAIGPARAGVFINFVPVVGVLLGWAMLGETIDLSLGVGGAMVVAGVLLINRL
jgi:drug/metabolite transporter (DMT)-like permease